MASLSEPDRQSLIRLHFKLRELSFTKLAREHDVTPSSVSAVVSGRGRSERLENAIATAIGLSRADLWPEREQGKLEKEAAMT